MYQSTLRRLWAATVVVVFLSIPAMAVERQVFVTTVKGTGNLSSWADAGAQSGADAGDAVCQARATAAGLANASSYRAWLSTTSADAFCRVQGLVGTRESLCGSTSSADPPIGPWVRRDGEPFAARLARMAGPEHVVYQPIFYDEYGALLPEVGNSAWTGTDPDGAGVTHRCDDWSSSSSVSYGNTGAGWRVGRNWTQFGSVHCDVEARLICFEIGAGDPLTLENHGGELAFVTSVNGTGDLSSWTDAGGQSGIDAGDAICRSRAAAGGLPAASSFVAWLSDSSTDAIDRLTDGPFVRIDGFKIADAKADMFVGTPRLENGINVNEFGNYYVEPYSYSYVWTGTAPTGLVAVGNHCDGWVNDIADGVVGSSAATRLTWTQNGVGNCTQIRPIYCFSTAGLIMWDNFERGDLSRWSANLP
ncbi:MAG: hypothetical protein K8R59_09635 [Thermoanaerobaculales bacterium]|nr:hypothetical protein [Thermoanaerobaculales bacterium]